MGCAIYAEAACSSLCLFTLICGHSDWGNWGLLVLHPYAVVFQNQALFGIPMTRQWEWSTVRVGNKLVRFLSFFFFLLQDFIYPSSERGEGEIESWADSTPSSEHNVGLYSRTPGSPSEPKPSLMHNHLSRPGSPNLVHFLWRLFKIIKWTGSWPIWYYHNVPPIIIKYSFLNKNCYLSAKQWWHYYWDLKKKKSLCKFFLHKVSMYYISFRSKI